MYRTCDKADEISLFCRYERLLRRAKTEDLTEVSGIGCLYQSGVDRQGRPVVVFIGKWFPATKVSLDKVRACALKIDIITDHTKKKSAAQYTLVTIEAFLSVRPVEILG